MACNNRYKEWYYFKLQITSQDEQKDKETVIDLITWHQWIRNALKRSHGIFGEGVEYSVLNQDDKMLYCRVNFLDRQIFASAITTYTSSEDLVGYPLIVMILQETSDLETLQVGEDDKLWYAKVVEEEKDMTEC